MIKLCSDYTVEESMHNSHTFLMSICMEIFNEHSQNTYTF